MKAKVKGSRVEKELQYILENNGYNVTKSGGSFGLFDLVAINQNHLLLVQVKANRISGKEVKKIAKFDNCPSNTYKLVAIKKDYHGWEIYGVCYSNGETKKYSASFLSFVKYIK